MNAKVVPMASREPKMSPPNLPAPLVPAGVSMRGMEFMPLHIARLQRSRSWLRAKRRPELGFYLMNLWMAAWQNEPAGSLEADDDVLADAAMCDPDRWPEVRAEVMQGWVLCADGRFYHAFLATVVSEAWERRRTYSTRGQAAAAGRWQKPPANDPAPAGWGDPAPSKPAPKPRQPSLPTVNGEPEGFVEFWAVYPLAKGKGEARKAWPAAVRKVRGNWRVIVEAAARYAKAMAGRETCYIKYPSGWLNGERWNDAPDPQRPAGGPNRPPPGPRPSKLDWMTEGLDVDAMLGRESQYDMDGHADEVRR